MRLLCRGDAARPRPVPAGRRLLCRRGFADRRLHRRGAGRAGAAALARPLDLSGDPAARPAADRPLALEKRRRERTYRPPSPSKGSFMTQLTVAALQLAFTDSVE